MNFVEPAGHAFATYLIRRAPIPQHRGSIAILGNRSPADHLYLGTIVKAPRSRPTRNSTAAVIPPGENVYKSGDHVLFVASAGWLVENCPHLQDLNPAPGDTDLLFIKEEDIVARVLGEPSASSR